MLDSLVWRMDEVRATATSPLEAAMAAASLMMDSVAQMPTYLIALLDEQVSWQATIFVSNLP